MSAADAPPGRPHVALAIQGLHEKSGGAERVLVDVANGLRQRGFPVSVLTYQPSNGPSFYPLGYGIGRFDGRRREPRGAGRRPTESLAPASQRRRSVAVAVWLATYGPKIIRYRQLLKIVKPDIVIGFLPSTFPYMVLAATGSRVQTVASLHNVPTRDLGDEPDRWDHNPVDIAVRRWALRLADATTVLLPSFVDQLDAHVRAKAYVIPNLVRPYDGDLVDVSDGEHNTILAVGRLAPAKDHATLIRAWAQLEASFPAWDVRIIGSGPLRNQLDSLIEQHDLRRVTIDEPTSEIEAAYTSAKILAMPSIYEGFGLVTAEAMACGLPVIGFADCEGTNEIVVDGRNGLLVDPGEDRVTALASALRRLIAGESDRVRLGGAAHETVEAFKPDAVIDAWQDMILRVAQGDGS